MIGTVSWLFLAIAVLFVAFVMLDYQRDPAGGFFNLKRKIWLRIAAIFAAISLLLAILQPG